MKTRNLIAQTVALTDAFYTSTGSGWTDEYDEPDLGGRAGKELLAEIGGLMMELGAAIGAIRTAQEAKAEAKA